MIDFNNAYFLFSDQVAPDAFGPMIQRLLQQNERVVYAFKGLRNGAVFTPLRIIAFNIEDNTYNRKHYTSLPYSKISAYSVMTIGPDDLMSRLEIWLTGLGKVGFSFQKNADLTTIGQFIDARIL